MKYALIFAGGVGSRMNTTAKPKQFLEIHGKPIIIHTIEHFENHYDIDEICVVCVSEWIEYTKKLIEKYNIQKVKWVIEGGRTALESQYMGLKKIYDDNGCEKEDIVLIHDGVRPLINEMVISDCIAKTRKYGSAITVSPAVETIIHSDANDTILSTISRTDCKMARAPQTFKLQDIIETHDKAINDGNHNFIDSASMMLHYGYTLHTVDGPTENIKITNPVDFYVLKALLEAKENSQIFGL